MLPILISFCSLPRYSVWPRTSAPVGDAGLICCAARTASIRDKVLPSWRVIAALVWSAARRPYSASRLRTSAWYLSALACPSAPIMEPAAEKPTDARDMIGAAIIPLFPSRSHEPRADQVYPSSRPCGDQNFVRPAASDRPPPARVAGPPHCRPCTTLGCGRNSSPSRAVDWPG